MPPSSRNARCYSCAMRVPARQRTRRFIGLPGLFLLLMSSAIGCVHNQSLSSRPNTVSDTRPFTRTNYPVGGTVGASVSTQGTAESLYPPYKPPKPGPAAETQPLAQPPPPAAPKPPPAQIAPSAPVDNNGAATPSKP
jgi:hypothetical protein